MRSPRDQVAGSLKKAEGAVRRKSTIFDYKMTHQLIFYEWPHGLAILGQIQPDPSLIGWQNKGG
jgi:hypothetical protein